MLVSETTHRRYKGQDSSTVKTKLFNFPLKALSKDLVRELAREAKMPAYWNHSRQQMIDYLNQQDDLPIRNVQLKVFRGGVAPPRDA
jgi:tRNA U34 2-thiouridine synthase MnmA/TrmU